MFRLRFIAAGVEMTTKVGVSGLAKEEMMDWLQKLMDHYYYSHPNWMGGTPRFHAFVLASTRDRLSCLEIGAGPSNPTSCFLAENFDCLDGLDIDPDVRGNSSLRQAFVYDGREFPVDDCRYECVIANYVLEHVEEPEPFLSEVFRVLKPNGCFVFRTPNQWHYVSLAARLIPNALHDRVVRRCGNLSDDAHAPYPTYHRMNARRRLTRLARQCQADELEFVMLEAEPAYLRFHPLAFRLGVAYERTVNASPVMSGLRANIIGCMRKTGQVSPGKRAA